MNVKVTKKFYGTLDGEVYPREIPVGAVIDGDLAKAALEMEVGEKTSDEVAAIDTPTKDNNPQAQAEAQAAEAAFEADEKAKKPAANKAKKPPENK